MKMFVIQTNLRFNGCQVCLAAPVKPPDALGGLFENYFKKLIDRSKVPNYAELMGMSFGISVRLARGEKILNKAEE